MSELRRLFDLIPYQLKNYSIKNCVSDKKDGNWNNFSTEGVQSVIDKFSLGLLKLGVNRGDKLAIISPNRTEWNFVDLGILQPGGVDFPFFPKIRVQEIY